MSELYSYPSNDYRSYLAHHGVKGMKWGVRHDKIRDAYESQRKRKFISEYEQYYGKNKNTSKNYDKARKKSLERHKKGNKSLLALGLLGGAAVASNVPSLYQTALFAENIKAGTNIFIDTRKNAKIETVKRIAEVTVASAVIGTAIWMTGRNLLDSVSETLDIRESNKKK